MYDNSALYAFDNEYREKYPLLCGVDEAGRGPLCGPVSVAAVILRPEVPIEGIRDSKKISEKNRKILYERIVQDALCYHVVLVEPEEIDRLNILQASLAGMRRAAEGLSVTPDMVLVDGNKVPAMQLPCESVVKGDSVSACIAAASILAKVTRDRYMKELDAAYPQYKLAQHKGYPTKLHYELLAQHGLQSFYRRSFLKNWNRGR